MEIINIDKLGDGIEASYVNYMGDFFNRIVNPIRTYWYYVHPNGSGINISDELEEKLEKIYLYVLKNKERKDKLERILT